MGIGLGNYEKIELAFSLYHSLGELNRWKFGNLGVLTSVRIFCAFLLDCMLVAQMKR